MNIKSFVNKLKRICTLVAGILIFAAITVYALYKGYLNILEFGQPIGEVETYSRFNFALIPMGIFTLVMTIISIFYIITGERWEDRYGGALPLSSLAFVGIALILTLITPSIYESKYEKAGLEACSGTPVSYLPLYAKRFAVNPSLCKK
ncbi:MULTISPECIES: DUF2079 domain-containing protein [Vibrio]|uniref:DUF2079 domain-containing protein n=1 Tax=Vibrio TaxID=662 RepID=UPI000C8480A8|nr:MULTISPECIES: DUF2079 domain-containing protein [Vibrio]MDH5939570.1 DUF2079 domain-containing protein [Vibrio splendidus]PML06249.1 DUF2079 domain-containing protein [Vibrio lentus]